MVPSATLDDYYKHHYGQEGCISSLVMPRQCVRRSLFSDSYLWLDVFAEQRNKASYKYNDHFMQNFKRIYETKGLKKVYSSEIIRYMKRLENEEELELACQIIKEIIADGTRDAELLNKVTFLYFKTCLFFGFTAAARNLWTDPVFSNSTYASDRRTRRRYFALLYRTKEYEELVNEVMISAEKLDPLEAMNIDELSLGMAAMIIIRSPESIEKAHKLFDVSKRGNVKASRFVYLYAYVCYIEGRNALAYELITGKFSHLGPLSSNMRLEILTSQGRLEDAFELLRLLMVACKASGEMTLYRQSMKMLADAVVAKKDTQLSQEFAAICGQLNKIAKLSDETVEKALFRPMQRSERIESQHGRRFHNDPDQLDNQNNRKFRVNKRPRLDYNEEDQ